MIRRLCSLLTSLTFMLIVMLLWQAFTDTPEARAVTGIARLREARADDSSGAQRKQTRGQAWPSDDTRRAPWRHRPSARDRPYRTCHRGRTFASGWQRLSGHQRVQARSVLDLRIPFTLKIKKKAYTGLETSLKGAWKAREHVVVVYARVPADNSLREYCVRRGWEENVHVVTDLEELIRSVRAAKVEIVLVSGLSGLGRSPYQLVRVLRDFIAHKVTLIIPRAGINWCRFYTCKVEAHGPSFLRKAGNCSTDGCARRKLTPRSDFATFSGALRGMAVFRAHNLLSVLKQGLKGNCTGGYVRVA